MTSEPPILPAVAARRRSLFAKITGIVVLIVLLHVPLILTHGVLRDRQSFRAQAVGDITALWGGTQRLIGPVLAVPYTYRAMTSRTKLVGGQWVQVDEPGVCTAIAYFLPDELKVDGSAAPENRRRGIYDTIVYSAQLKFSGLFKPDFAAAGIDAERIDWAKARVGFGASDLHGLRSISGLRRPDVVDEPFEMDGASANPSWPLSAPATLVGADPFRFEFECVVQGSGDLTVAPVGKSTVATLRSEWRDPSFVGSWLPVERSVKSEGFDAEWRISAFTRDFPQNWTSRTNAAADMTKRIDDAVFGVRFRKGLDAYAMVERAQKYGVLFFVLIFAVFFLFEVTAELRIHPLQYVMVGAALCLFFLGFLALTEFWPSSTAYAVAAGVCTAMIALYAWSFLRAGSRTLVVAGGLGATYGYLYFVLQSQDYALIAGTFALFAGLAVAMFCTRRIDWYAVDAAAQSAAVGKAETLYRAAGDIGQS